MDRIVRRRTIVPDGFFYSRMNAQQSCAQFLPDPHKIYPTSIRMQPANPPKKVYSNKIRNFQSTMKICNEFGMEIVPKTLEGPLPKGEAIIWAIPADDPGTVKYYQSLSGEQYFPCNEKEAIRSNGSKRTANMIHHNYLVEGKPVLCAGESTHRNPTKNGRALTNKSGHYTPDNDCLVYAKTLFEAKGNPIELLYGMKEDKERMERKERKERKEQTQRKQRRKTRKANRT